MNILKIEIYSKSYEYRKIKTAYGIIKVVPWSYFQNGGERGLIILGNNFIPIKDNEFYNSSNERIKNHYIGNNLFNF